MAQGGFGEQAGSGVLVTRQCGLLLFSSTQAHPPRASQSCTPLLNHPQTPSFLQHHPVLCLENTNPWHFPHSGLHQFQTALGKQTLMLIIFVREREEVFLFFYMGKETSPCFMCVPAHGQLFQPLCSCLTHRGCGCHCLLSVHLFRPCALLFPYQFQFKASLHRFPWIKVCLPHTSHPPWGRFYPAGAAFHHQNI